MVSALDEIAQSFRLADALDMAVATAMFFAIFQWIRNRSAHALLIVLIVGASLYLLSNWLRMYLTLAMFRVGLSLVVFGLIVVFQKDLRHGCERLASWHPFHRGKVRDSQKTLTKALIETAMMLAEEKTGALIVIPAKQSLDRHLQGGVELAGRVSVPLLHSLFHSKSQGHDGAVVLEGEQVDRFGVHLPLSSNFEALGSVGTRHAAALGLAEQSDAFIIVVSEERGVVSVAHRGEIHAMQTAQDLGVRLENFYSGRLTQKTKLQQLKWSAGTVLVFLLGFGAAGLCWLQVANQRNSVQRVIDHIPIETQRTPSGWVIDSVQPQEVQVNITGSERAFSAFEWNRLKAKLDLTNIQEGQQTIYVGDDAIKLPAEMSIVGVEPNVIRVTAYKTRTVNIPIKIKTQGQLPEGFVLDGQQGSLKQVLVKVQASRISNIKSIPTEPINLTNRNSTITRTVQLDFPKGVWPTSDTPTSLQVELKISRSKSP